MHVCRALDWSVGLELQVYGYGALSFDSFCRTNQMGWNPEY